MRPLAWIFYFSMSFAMCLQATAQRPTQYSQFIDDRDGKTYQTVSIGNTLWLAENIRYKTERSEAHKLDNLDSNTESYYYPLEDLEEACPAGFRIVRKSDWEQYFRYLISLKAIPSSYISKTSTSKKNHDFSSISVSDNMLQPFDEPNPLKLRATGHTEAGNIVAPGSMNIWIKNGTSTDPKYHLHLEPAGYNIHTHKHHITTRKKRLRKFSIRCVSDQTP